MKVVVSGSRTITDLETVREVIFSAPFEITELIHGGAKGVDSLVEQLAKEANIPTRIFLPDWKKLGKRAGPLRNIEMINEADALIAVWDGQSKGAKQAVDYATKKGLPVYVKVFEQFAK